MKPPYDDPGRNLARFGEMFDAEGVDWAVIGGLAVVHAGVAGRETVDADFVVSGLAHLEERLAEMGVRWMRLLREEHDGSPYMVQGETADGMRFDIYIASIAFEEEVLATKDEHHMASPEAVVVYKLVAGRPQDIADVRAMLCEQPGMANLDIDFIGRWATELDVIDRWRRYAAEARHADRLP